MLKRALIFILLIPLLFNGVSATLHDNEEDHHSQVMHHIHLDSKHHSESEITSSNNESTEHDSHEHLHIYLSVYIKTDELNHFEKRGTSSSFRFNSEFSSLVPSPPVPPPNI